MPPVFQVLTGKDAGTKYSLVHDRVRMGRHPDCEVMIDVNSVSRFHAHMVRDKNRYVIEDLQSRNGTFVNGKKIQGRVELKDNDRVKICDVLFVYRGEVEPRPGDDEEDGTHVLTTIDAKGTVDALAKVNPEAKLRAILEISQAIGQTLDLDELFPKILEALFSVFPQADRTFIIQVDDSGNLVPSANKHRRDQDDVVRFSRTIVRQAMDEKKAILSADAAEDERFNMAVSIADFSIRSIMCVPLLAQDGTAMGVLQIDSEHQNRRFDADDLQLLASVASQVSVSIQNAQMHAEILNQERIRRELGFARDIQRGFLPSNLPKLEGYEFWPFYEAAGQVGGDYYDLVSLPDGRVAAILGDVSGKGVSAALIMAKASSDTKVALLTKPDDLSGAVAEINNSIFEATPDDRFITMAICVIDPKDHKISIVNAGHMSPIVQRADGSLDEPADASVTGLPLGILQGVHYEVAETHLAPGESVVVFSDGISEAMNANHDEYGIERIKQRMSTVKLSVTKLGEYLLKDVRSHVGGHKQSDDITLLVFGRTAEA